jgi:hypothetical protein
MKYIIGHKGQKIARQVIVTVTERPWRKVNMAVPPWSSLALFSTFTDIPSRKIATTATTAKSSKKPPFSLLDLKALCH